MTIKNMSEIYWSKSTDALLKLRSQKYLALLKAEHDQEGFFNMHDRNVLKQQIRWIDAILAARAEQAPLL